MSASPTTDPRNPEVTDDHFGRMGMDTGKKTSDLIKARSRIPLPPSQTPYFLTQISLITHMMGTSRHVSHLTKNFNTPNLGIWLSVRLREYMPVAMRAGRTLT